jgi:hypothetical protein
MASYGTTGGVAALTKRYTNGSAVFDGTTNPTSTTVTTWLAEISSMVNMALATSGFAVPITDADVTPALDGFVNAMTADLVHAANSTGRFFSERALENGVSPIKAINNDVIAWVENMAAGLVVLGATRSSPSHGLVITSTVINPQYLRTVNEDNSSNTTMTDWASII